MKATLNFEVSVRLNNFACDAKKSHLEVVCIFGPPTATPDAPTEIPLTIKEMLLDGKLLGYNERELMLNLIGGTEAIKLQLRAI